MSETVLGTVMAAACPRVFPKEKLSKPTLNGGKLFNANRKQIQEHLGLVMLAIVENLRAFLASTTQILTPDKIGLQTPAMSGDLPAIVLSIALDERVPAKVNAFARTGDSPVVHTDLLEVSPTNPVFSPSLDLMRVEPLPVRKNPASHEHNFGASDLPVRNLTMPQQPVSYRFVPKPVAHDEYTFRTADAHIVFGQPQTVSDKLEVTHWTVAPRDDITIDRFQGKLTIELWTETFEQAEALYAAIENKLKRERNLLRQGGFYRFAPYTLEAATAILQTTAFGSNFPLWRMRLGYRFAFEKEQGGESSSGSVIRRIDVDLRGEQAEEFSLPVITAN